VKHEQPAQAEQRCSTHRQSQVAFGVFLCPLLAALSWHANKKSSYTKQTSQGSPYVTELTASALRHYSTDASLLRYRSLFPSTSNFLVFCFLRYPIHNPPQLNGHHGFVYTITATEWLLRVRAANNRHKGLRQCLATRFRPW
jgi:hypothetical protein